MADNFDKNGDNTGNTRAETLSQSNSAPPDQESEETIREYCRILQDLLN